MQKNSHYVITIGREFGSGGHEIGKKLAQALDIKFFDGELISEASRQSGVCEDMLGKSDEKAPGILDYALLGGWGNESVLSCGSFYVLLSKVIKGLVQEQSCVIVGRTADYIMREHPHCVSIFIHAPEDYKAKRVCQEQHIDKDKALEMMQKKDHQRAKYYSFYTDNEWGKSNNYDLSIDSSKLGINGTVALIHIYIEQVLRDIL